MPTVLSIGGLVACQDVHEDDFVTVDNDTIVCNEVYKIKDYEDKTIFYDEVRAQIDPGAKVAVTNLLSSLHRPIFFSKLRPCRVRMHGATSTNLITPEAVGFLRVPTNNLEGFMDVKCYYSPNFTSTLLADNAVLDSTRFKGQYSGIELRKFFAHNEEVIE